MLEALFSERTGVRTISPAIAREIDLPLRAFSGARAHRAVHTGPMKLAEHAHDWPCLVLHLLGSYTELNDLFETVISGPAAVLHCKGDAHQEQFGDACSEVIILHFDPDWLGLPKTWTTAARTTVWGKGASAIRAKALAEAWLDPVRPEGELSAATARFLCGDVGGRDAPGQPPWLQRVQALMDAEIGCGDAAAMARALGMSRGWLAHSYRRWMGEGMHEAVLRRRVERAISALRETDLPLCEIAYGAGFCDQSHMNRALSRWTGRTPTMLRQEARPAHPPGASRPRPRAT